MLILHCWCLRLKKADDVGMALFINDQTDALVATEYCSSSVVHGAILTIAHKMPSNMPHPNKILTTLHKLIQ